MDSAENMRVLNRIGAIPLEISIILGPFIYYAILITQHLMPTEAHDAFAYLWQQPFNFYYLTGRSLTQRMTNIKSHYYQT